MMAAMRLRLAIKDLPMKIPSFSRIILPVLALIGIIGSAIYIGRSQPNTQLTNPELTPPTTPEAQRKSGSVAGSGVIEPSGEIVDIATHVPGIVARVFVEPGAQVAAGQPLLEIDSRDARAAITEAAARLDSARAGVAAAATSLKVAENQYALYRNVNDERAVSRQEVIARRGTTEDARAQLGVAQAQVRQTQAQLFQARVELDRRTVRAPRVMQVLQVLTRAGEYAGTAGNDIVLMKLGVTQPMHVRIDVDENEIERVALGQPAIISPKGNAKQQVRAAFVRAEPLIVPKRSLTNSATERVDVRVLQLIYALPAGNNQFFVGQQVDGFAPAKVTP
jgi:HlyD family secretion protein